MPGHPDQELIEDVAGFFFDPLGFVLYVFPWREEGPLKDEDGPDEWQRDVLGEIRAALLRGESAGAAAGDAIRIAIASGHGIGKTALIAWVILWFISTRDYPQIPVTANTQSQLLQKTWRELARWHRMSLVKHWFEWTATKFYKVEYPDSWFASAVVWSERNAEAFAGTHEKFVLVIYDEASAIPTLIWETTEGAMTTRNAIWLAFGNPTRPTGRFAECWGKFKHRWVTRQIDSRKGKRANQAQIKQWIEDYGEDSDFVRIRVRGVFPRSSSTQFIGQDLVDACSRYQAMAFDALPKLLSVDVARFGDDQTVVGIKQGRKITVKAKWRGLDLVNVANRVIEFIEEEQPDGIVIDGDGYGAGVVDIIKSRNYHLVAGQNILTEFHGGAGAIKDHVYYNRRAEVWGLMREAMKDGLQIGDDPELHADLIGPEYFYTTRGGHDVIQLEAKKDMKARGLSSPDVADMIAMSFAITLREKRRKSSERKQATRAGGSGGWMSF